MMLSWTSCPCPFKPGLERWVSRWGGAETAWIRQRCWSFYGQCVWELDGYYRGREECSTIWLESGLKGFTADLTVVIFWENLKRT